ncbi:hypothetical protein [Oxalobacter formigenes]|uniref:hypothetical protein n=1 Tax=Oxalobacter formigenes TaxID=847 RepID=UPI00241FE81F|nr:hypothetical protein [Oxalobacter formigenes]
MAKLPSKELLNGTKDHETTTGEFRLAMGNIRDFLFGLFGDDSSDKWLVRETLGAAEKFIGQAQGTGDVLIGKFTPTIRELVHGMTVLLRASAANTAGVPTLKADETSALPIVKGDKRALDVGDIAGKGHWLELKYDRIWNKWVLQNPAKGVSLKEEIDDKADKLELLDYLPLAGGSMNGALSVTSGLTVEPEDMTGLTGEGGEMVLKGAGYYQNIHIDNTAGKWRVAGSIYENSLVFDPASGTLACANVTANITDINDHIVQSWTDGTGWWKKYRSGWVEQGGYSSAGNGAAGITTVFYLPFANSTYTVETSKLGAGSPVINVVSRANTSFNANCEGQGGSGYYSGSAMSWNACGQGA